MGIFDQAKDLSRGHEAETDQGIEKFKDDYIKVFGE